MAGSEVGADLWINEYITPWDIYSHGVTRVLAYRRTPFQEMVIVETGAYGKALVLDGKWQSCTGDEFLYHEPLVQPAMLQHGGPASVLVLGGGEGATSREVLRWRTVERVVMVDIDGDVVSACREHLPEMHRGSFDDPRHEVVIEDAVKVLAGTECTYDVVISDLSDPIEDGPSFQFFTREYFERARLLLNPGGVFVIQAGPVSPQGLPVHARLASTMRAVFPHTHSYATLTNTYGAPWSYIMASLSPIESRPDPIATDRILAEKTTGGLTMIDGTALLGILQAPRHVRAAIAEETQVYTLDEPPRFFGKGVLSRRGGPGGA